MRLGWFATAALALSACTLVTNLTGLSGGIEDRTSEPPEGGAFDVEAEREPAEAGPPEASDDASEGGLPPNVLSHDDFETLGTCDPWKPTAVATAEVFTPGYSGASACKVCLSAPDVSSGIHRFFPETGGGTYTLSAYVKPIRASDWRLTWRFAVDGGTQSFYATGPLTPDTWEHVVVTKVVDDAYGELDVELWFGTTFDADDCIVVDEITVRRDP